MHKAAIVCVILLQAIAGLAIAAEEYLVLRVDKPASVTTLHDVGLLFMADLGEAYLVLGDGAAAGRLGASGAQFTEVVTLEPGENVLLLSGGNQRDEVRYMPALIALGKGRYLAVVRTHEIGDVGLLPFEKQVLFPRDFREPCIRTIPRVPAWITPKPEIQDMVDAVESDSVYRHISRLSGNEPVLIGGTLDTLLTRYTRCEDIESAVIYALERLEEYGVEAAYHDYTISERDYWGVDIVSSMRGWIAGHERIYDTEDGGAFWHRQRQSPMQDFWSVCFIDSLRGWISAGWQGWGSVYRTTDGGAHWYPTITGTKVELRDVCFLDPLRGWVVGYDGVILQTSNGGEDWYPSDTTLWTPYDFYGLDVGASNRGWACGELGQVYFWNGTTWTAQASGTTEHLLSVDFADDNVGYMVGHGGTILKTVDGGQHWLPQTSPPEANPYLQGTCFVSPLEGWAVGFAGTIIHTDDGGATWQCQPVPEFLNLRWVDFINDQEGWAVGYLGTILHTADGGNKWESQGGNIEPTDLYCYKNVVGTRPGTTSAEQVVICGHLDCMSDTWCGPAPGADDNASGTAAVLEAARILAGWDFRKTIKFICFSGEEQGLWGSRAYALEAKARRDTVLAVLNFDMIGWSPEGLPPEDLDLIGNPESEWLVDFALECADAYVPDLGKVKLIDQTMVWSDHASFWATGYDAFLGIEDCPGTYPYYHTVNDTVGNLNMGFTSKVVKLAVATMAEIAEYVDMSSVDAARGETRVTGVRPNPSRTSTTISLVLESAGPVEVAIYDVEGRLVQTLLRTSLGAGRHEVNWDGSNVEGTAASSGIYFARIDTGARSLASKVVLLQ